MQTFSGYFEPALFVIWVLFWSFWFFLAWKTRSPVKRRDSRWHFTLPVVAWIAVWIIINLFYPGLSMIQVIPDTIPVRLAGTIITLAGLGFAIRARLFLGTNWSGQPVVKVDHQLVRTGPYRIVRHPIYTGILTAFAGTAIVIGEVWAVMMVFIALTLFLVKIRIEEEFMIGEFGGEYIAYKKEVKALIPYII